MSWVSIKYRDFYDFPRAFLIEHQGEVFFFDGGFDEEADAYSDSYRVYRLPSDVSHALDTESWGKFSELGTLVGEVPVGIVTFDASKRAAVQDSIFAHF